MLPVSFCEVYKHSELSLPRKNVLVQFLVFPKLPCESDTIKSHFACFSLQENQTEGKQEVTRCLCREEVLKISNNKRFLFESVDAYCVKVTKIYEQ